MKYILIAYFLGNIFAKNCCSRTVYVRMVASQRWDVFLRHSVYLTVYTWPFCLFFSVCLCFVNFFILVVVMSCMRVCRKQALSRVKYYYY